MNNSNNKSGHIKEGLVRNTAGETETSATTFRTYSHGLGDEDCEGVIQVKINIY